MMYIPLLEEVQFMITIIFSFGFHLKCCCFAQVVLLVRTIGAVSSHQWC